MKIHRQSHINSTQEHKYLRVVYNKEKKMRYVEMSKYYTTRIKKHEVFKC